MFESVLGLPFVWKLAYASLNKYLSNFGVYVKTISSTRYYSYTVSGILHHNGAND